MSYLYTNEIVFAGHPDKVCDQISDALLDAYLEQDSESRCGIEVVGGKGKIFITGEVTSNAQVDVQSTANRVLRDLGYNDTFEIIENLGRQSPDIAYGVDAGGAGDQGMMFGYACRETEKYIPKAMAILQEFSREYNFLREADKRFLPDGKAQITGIYDNNNKLVCIKDFTISYQNTENNRAETDKKITDLAKTICKKYGINPDCILNFHINPTGKFLLGGFDADAGLTGRKTVVDTYESFSRSGGGCLSGKDPTKVDRSATYKARQLAIKVLERYPNSDWCEVQLSYAIGMDEPLAVTARTNEGILDMTWAYAECTPENIIKDLDLKNICYEDTARFGNFGWDFPWDLPPEMRA